MKMRKAKKTVGKGGFKVISALKEKITGWFGSFSAVLSTLGSSWSACHGVCTAFLAFLAMFGVIITGMPLLFLFQYNVQLWIIALVLLLASIILFFRMQKCVPRNLLVFNTGAVIAGIPAGLLNLQPFSWTAGGIIMLLAIILFLHSRFGRKMKREAIK